MPYPTCPHCGANRENMPDSQKCWRCGRLPTTAVAASAPPEPLAPPPPRPQPISVIAPEPMPNEPRYIPLWLGVSGTLGLLLFGVLLVGGLFLFLTADAAPEETDTLSALGTLDAVATAFPTNTNAPREPLPTAELPATTAINTASSEPAVSDPFSATTAAIEVNDSAATLLPAPSPMPTHTPTPTLSPTPIICPGVVLPRLQTGGVAEVVVAGTIRMRDQAGLGGNLILNIGRGETVNVTGAPICTDGFLWWPIALIDGTVGWVAEGDAGQYFLEPR